jgi:hypothetical protein
MVRLTLEMVASYMEVSRSSPIRMEISANPWTEWAVVRIRPFLSMTMPVDSQVSPVRGFRANTLTVEGKAAFAAETQSEASKTSGENAARKQNR